MKVRWVLVIIFFLAVLIRSIWFTDSVYFGFDEARDAYISQSIYKNFDIKLIGPPANAPNLFHGPFYWYLIGPIHLLSGGDPYLLSIVFRFLNALGVFLVFIIARLYFGNGVGVISALLYAFSFEQNQYAFYTIHPSLTIFSWMFLFWGAGILLRYKKDKNFLGLPLILGGASLAVQFELLMVHAIGAAFAVLILLRRKLEIISRNSLILAVSFSALFLGTYLIRELKYGFVGVQSALMLFNSGYSVMETGDNRVTFYLKKFLLILHDNILPVEGLWLYFFSIILLLPLFIHARKNIAVQLILIWIFAGILLLPLGGYNAYYVNAGLGVGLIIGSGFVLNKLYQKARILGVIVLGAVLIGNFLRVYDQNKNSLIVDLKPQPFMKLSDELKLIDKMYSYSNNQGFTIRVTGIPYRVQTVWAYLLENMTLKKWGYLPYLETGLVEGFPGKLPVPKNGSTCARFLIREPIRGIPQNLIDQDIKEENLFSDLVKEETIGHFTLQTRKSKDPNCHNKKP